MVEGVEVLVYADRTEAFDATPLERPDRDHRLLFPAPDADDLTPPMLQTPNASALTLVLLDGTWRQASRMRRRVPQLRAMRCLRLPAAAPSSWTIRRANQPERLCTLEAVIRVIALSGREEEARAMWEAMKWIEGRLLFMRGRRPAPPSLEEIRAELAGVSLPWRESPVTRS